MQCHHCLKMLSLQKKCMRMDNEIDAIVLQALQLERMIVKMSIQKLSLIHI